MNTPDKQNMQRIYTDLVRVAQDRHGSWKTYRPLNAEPDMGGALQSLGQDYREAAPAETNWDNWRKYIYGHLGPEIGKIVCNVVIGQHEPAAWGFSGNRFDPLPETFD